MENLDVRRVVNLALRRAVYWAVSLTHAKRRDVAQAVYAAVYEAVGRAEYAAVYDAVYATVYATVDLAMYETIAQPEAPPHPGLELYLAEVA